MSGRAKQSEPVLQPARRDRGAEIHEPARGEPRGAGRVAARVRVGVELEEIVPRRLFDQGHEGRRVDALELFVRRGARVHALAARVEALRSDPIADRGETPGMLRMIVGRTVPEEEIVVDEAGHRPRIQKRAARKRRA
jgi:hypothetical protein